jgi:predicted metal-binding membrane protein
MSSMPMQSAVVMTATMMVAMMLPSLAVSLSHSHRAGQRTTMLAAGYLTVWMPIAVALSALPPLPASTWGTAPVLLCAGAVQCSPWKARQLHRCRAICAPVLPESATALIWWLRGCRFGVDCCLSCAAPMAVLYVAGLMDTRMMMLITAVITAERVAPGGARIARVTGGMALIIGLVMCI